MELKINGKIKLIMDSQSWDSGFTKREFVVTTNEQYPQDVKLEFIKDKTTLLDGLSEGEEVEVSFNVRGNEYNGKYYVNLQAWRLTKVEIKLSPDCCIQISLSSAAADTKPVNPNDKHNKRSLFFICFFLYIVKFVSPMSSMGVTMSTCYFPKTSIVSLVY